MLQLKREHDGATVKFKFKNAHTIDEAEGRVFLHDGVFLILSDSKWLRGSSSADLRTNPYPELPYFYNFGTSGLISRGSCTDALISAVLEINKLLYKNDNSGGLFRKVFKTDGTLIFVGGVCKNPEDCEKPSALINVMELEYLKMKGWDFHKKELSAEEKLNKISKKPRFA